MSDDLRAEITRLRAALAECCAPFDTGPTTVLEGAALVAREFQRRMDIAARFGVSESLPKEIAKGRAWPDALAEARRRTS